MQRSFVTRLKSRKFQAFIIAVITAYLKIYFPQIPVEAVLAVLGAAGFYIAGESYVDAKAVQKQ